MCPVSKIEEKQNRHLLFVLDKEIKYIQRLGRKRRICRIWEMGVIQIGYVLHERGDVIVEDKVKEE